MKRGENALRELTSQEYRRFILPTALAGVLLFLTLLINLWRDADVPATDKYGITFMVVASAIYVTAYGFYLIPTRKYKDALIWANVVFSGIGLGAYAIFLPDHYLVYLNLLLFLTVISIATFSGRLPTLLLIVIATAADIAVHFNSMNSFVEWVKHLGVPAISLLLCEMINRVRNISREQMHRLEIINTFSRQVAAARDRGQVFEQLNEAIPNALIADSYYVSAIENDEVHVILCYDDGEYFNNVRTPAAGTLTNWVVQNQRELFLPDLRLPIDIEDIKIVLVGKDKTSLSWIGVPINSRTFRGVLALGSYEPNAFNRGDLELLSNLARHAALALENVDRQAELEERARLDSLTNVFNHGYFLEVLTRHANEALARGNSLSIIMLDVDYFKTYNDTYGHLAGDQILTLLCKAIRDHIKSTDAVGRWGGEEFVISLPNTSATHAKIVAERIGKSMRELLIADRDGTIIPAPTVSQGIAVFPQEADNIFSLIDLADQRLYAAKNRGRDQIESAPTPQLP
jgi:diguanylate cyclase (GGDEF)-like protein